VGGFILCNAIATLVFDKVAYKNVVSNGLVLDKNDKKCPSWECSRSFDTLVNMVLMPQDGI
jgi:isoleucyl-tRNA synthetase